MRPPLAGRRDAARRLAHDAGRLLGPLGRVLTQRSAAGASGDGAAAAPETVARTAPVVPEREPAADAAARLDAARERLRASIRPRDDDDDDAS